MTDPARFSRLVEPALLGRSGRIFYSGSAAFTGTPALYLLGLNPGGSPVAQVGETIGRDLEKWLCGPERWSAYVDESWAGAPAGTHGLQPRVRHLFNELGIDLRSVPASNVVFVRTNDEAALAGEKQSLLEACWPVHRAVIEGLGISTLLCLGITAGRWVRSLLGAEERVGRFVECNARAWSSEAHLGRDGICVVTLTHPGRADWRNPAADPAPLVRAMLAR